MQFELHALDHFVGYRIAITALGALVGELRQIVGLELDAVDLIIAAQLLDLLLTVLGRELVLAILIARELVVELLLCELLPPLFLRTKFLRNGEERHDRVVVEAVGLHLI